MPTATLTSKGQITIPKSVREHLNLVTGDEVDLVISEGGQVTLAPRCRGVAELFGLLRRDANGPAATVNEMDAALTEAVADDQERLAGRG